MEIEEDWGVDEGSEPGREGREGGTAVEAARGDDDSKDKGVVDEGEGVLGDKIAD